MTSFLRVGDFAYDLGCLQDWLPMIKPLVAIGKHWHTTGINGNQWHPMAKLRTAWACHWYTGKTPKARLDTNYKCIFFCQLLTTVTTLL